MAQNATVLCTVFVGFLFCFTTSCVEHKSQNVANTIPVSYDLQLSSQQIEMLSNRAGNGDGDAAYKLFEYYLFVKMDRNIGLKWLAVAATNNVLVAQYNMGMAYNGSIYPDLFDVSKAKYWFGVAAKNGYKDAEKRLNELYLVHQK